MRPGVNSDLWLSGAKFFQEVTVDVGTTNDAGQKREFIPLFGR